VSPVKYELGFYIPKDDFLYLHLSTLCGLMSNIRPIRKCLVELLFAFRSEKCLVRPRMTHEAGVLWFGLGERGLREYSSRVRHLRVSTRKELTQVRRFSAIPSVAGVPYVSANPCPYLDDVSQLSLLLR
jgi:hypothetical protein